MHVWTHFTSELYTLFLALNCNFFFSLDFPIALCKWNDDSKFHVTFFYYLSWVIQSVLTAHTFLCCILDTLHDFLFPYSAAAVQTLEFHCMIFCKIHIHFMVCFNDRLFFRPSVSTEEVVTLYGPTGTAQFGADQLHAAGKPSPLHLPSTPTLHIPTTTPLQSTGSAFRYGTNFIL